MEQVSTRKCRVRKKYVVNGKTVSESEFNNIRQKAINKSWKQEKELLQTTGKGTREWTAAEKQELMNTGAIKGYEGHHMKSAKAYPDSAGDRDNIQFLKGSSLDVNEHLAAHSGNYQNPTNGRYDIDTGETLEIENGKSCK